MTKPKTIRLAQPIAFDGKTITELSIRRPKVKDLRAMEEAAAEKPGQLDQGAAMVALLTGLPDAAVEELDAEDFTRVSETIAGFFGKGGVRETGEA